MPRSRRESRIYWRDQGSQERAYGDFRDFKDAGGGREALIPPGESLATTDPLIAQKLTADRVKELLGLRRNRAVLGIERQAGLESFASHHLVQKARARRVTEKQLRGSELQLRRAVEFFGAGRDLASIGMADVQRWVNHLQEMAGGLGGTLSDQTIRHHLNTLSNLYRRAAAEGYVLPGYNPVAALMDKPTAKREEARWLEVHEAALLLESARTYRPNRLAIATGHVYPIFATFLLTGGRKSEVLGLEVDDVSFNRKVITFRQNSWRRLKTSTSHRSVPLWPQLEGILREYVFGGTEPLGSLLFHSVRGPRESMITDLRRALDGVAERAGWKTGDIRTKLFRHTYCAARLQTLDRGAPVSQYTVATELGHGGDSLVRRVYGHLGEHRHRAEVVEYRIEQHEELLRDRLAALRAHGQPRNASERALVWPLVKRKHGGQV